MTDRDAYIALNMIDKLGPVRVRALVAALGSPQAVFACPERELVASFGGRTAIAGDPKDHSTTELVARLRALEEPGEP